MNYFETQNEVGDPIHDEIVCEAYHKKLAILHWAWRNELVFPGSFPDDFFTDPPVSPHLLPFLKGEETVIGERPNERYVQLEGRLEYEVGVVWGNTCHVDLALVAEYKKDYDVTDVPLLLCEIKSKREAQSASAWFRQTRKYREAKRVPCILVVAHDLGDTQRRYLDLAKVPVCDLRKL